MADGKKLDPIISEFDTQEEADAYDRWFRGKVEASLKNPGRSIPRVARERDHTPGEPVAASSGCSARTRRIARASAQKDRNGMVPHRSVTIRNPNGQRVVMPRSSATTRKPM